MNQNNILQIYRTYFPDTQGGIEEAIRQIAFTIKQHGFATRVLVPSNRVTVPDVVVVDGIEVHRVPELCEIASCNIYRSGFGKLKELIEWADIVHFHYPWPFQDILNHLFIKSSDVKTVVTYHSDIVRQKLLGSLYSPLQNSFLGSVDKIVATSPQYAATSDVLRRFKDKVEIVPLGLDRALIPQSDGESLAGVKQKVGEGFFLFVGVLRYYKGLDVFVEAAKLSNLPVVIAGAGPEMEALVKQVNRLGATNVVLMGRVTDQEKAALFELAGCVVLPSTVRAEGFGVTLIEGLSFGNPLITCDINTGVSFVNEKGSTGLVAKPGCPHSLAEAMTTLFNNDEMRAQMSIAALHRFESLFSGDSLGARYASIYGDLLGKTDTRYRHQVIAAESPELEY
jgi:rhamnosyl/mannosyltransferase